MFYKLDLAMIWGLATLVALLYNRFIIVRVRSTTNYTLNFVYDLY